MSYPTINTGLIQETRPDDFLAGIIPYKVVLESGDWRSYLPLGEAQFSQVADSMACVSFSNNNVAEISLKQQGFDYNFSDRASAKLSGTTHAGNTFAAVQDSNYRNGRILESDWPLPINFTWETFYAEIPKNIRDKAIFFDSDYQFISISLENLKYHLKQCPIQIAIPYPTPNHAVALVYIDGSTAWYFDSYPGSTNYLKTMPVSDITAAMKLIIKPKIMTKRIVVNDGGKIGTMVLEGYTGVVTFADTPEHLQALKNAFDFTGVEPTISLPQ